MDQANEVREIARTQWPAKGCSSDESISESIPSDDDDSSEPLNFDQSVNLDSPSTQNQNQTSVAASGTSTTSEGEEETEIKTETKTETDIIAPKPKPKTGRGREISKVKKEFKECKTADHAPASRGSGKKQMLSKPKGMTGWLGRSMTRLLAEKKGAKENNEKKQSSDQPSQRETTQTNSSSTQVSSKQAQGKEGPRIVDEPPAEEAQDIRLNVVDSKHSTAKTSSDLQSEDDGKNATTHSQQGDGNDNVNVNVNVRMIGGKAYDRNMLRIVQQEGGVGPKEMDRLLLLAETSELRKRTLEYLKLVYDLPFGNSQTQLGSGGGAAGSSSAAHFQSGLACRGGRATGSRSRSRSRSAVKLFEPPPSPELTLPQSQPQLSQLDEDEAQLVAQAKANVRDAQAAGMASRIVLTSSTLTPSRIKITKDDPAGSTHTIEPALLTPEMKGVKRRIDFFLRDLHPHSTRLNLSCHMLGDFGCGEVSRRLRAPRASGLVEVVLDDNRLTGRSLRSLTESLRCLLPSLQRLSLARNQLGHLGPPGALSEFLRVAAGSKTLTELDLSENRIGSRATIADGLGSFVRQCQNLSTLRLEGNPLGLKSLWAIADGVFVNTRVKELAVDASRWQQTKAYKRIQDCLERNRTQTGEANPATQTVGMDGDPTLDRRLRSLQAENASLREREIGLRLRAEREGERAAELGRRLQEVEDRLASLQRVHDGRLRERELRWQRDKVRLADAHGELLRMLGCARERVQVLREENSSLREAAVKRTQDTARTARALEARLTSFEDRDDERRKNDEDIFADFRARLRDIAVVRERQWKQSSSSVDAKSSS